MRERSQRFDPRQTMQKDTFEVFHYREPRPGTVEVHHHDFYEVYYLLGGKVEYWVDGHIIAMQPGDLLLLNPQELHRPMIDPQSPVYERIVLWIDRSFLENLRWSTMDLSGPFDGRTHLLRPDGSQRGNLIARVGELVREFYSNEPGSEVAAYGLFLQFMVLLNRLASQDRTKQEEDTPRSPLVQKTLSYIGENLDRAITLEQLAAELYVSKYHLSHAFSREVGVSVHKYILLRRLALARQLMAAGETAGQAAKASGFSDYTAFYRAFKSEYGISPREFAAEE